MSDDADKICEECGNDTVCAGYRYCSQCLEDLDAQGITP